MGEHIIAGMSDEAALAYKRRPTMPVVIITRHPDAENEWEVIGGEAEVIGIDLGAYFDGQPEDRDQAEEWSANRLMDADGIAEKVGNRDVFDRVVAILVPVVEDYLTRDEMLAAFHAKQEEERQS